jgi:quercetin dioxygenase-like cupin family protein
MTISTEVKLIQVPSGVSEEKWRPFPLFSGRTPAHDDIACHFSVLSPGHCPHPPHEHIEEELLIILDGQADILIADGPQPDGARVERLGPGSFVYYPAHQYHTIRNCPEAPVTYLMFKWRAASEKPEQLLGPTFFHFDRAALPDSSEGFAPHLLFEGATAHLSKLHAHITQLQPGAGYPPHADEYDVAIVVLSGRVETLGRTVESHSVIYYSAGELHGMKNAGEAIARYLVFEFHTPRVKLSFSEPSRNTLAEKIGSTPERAWMIDCLIRPIRAVGRRVSQLVS